MLDTTTKRRIDTARDILVGKIPDPKSQVEQITIALIYKFMEDMDLQSEEFGGARAFFSGDFERYSWSQLIRAGLGGHEVLNLYAEAIQKMPENPNIPELFRSIFRNAFLPYRDPETLRAFLKIVDEFEYDHSEKLGDAFEYLLSVLGSQGDAGQFRTPRHIIDFIVEIVNPQKTDVILDPACGTAGFLISAYKHILRQNSTNPQIAQPSGDLLSHRDRELIAKNIRGYDISPDMVRLSLVNLYLHGFADPKIVEYDTLTSEERWNEYADVILANPPFMSPKGGIRPHNRFSIQSKRSEVLFVDYILEHLSSNGRAGIIVPEGIIFQSQTAYKSLRKTLVEEALIAVVSLPAGVFNPYSGVKTSFLILDKTLAKKSSTVGFFKVNHDGFSLGAQRREGGPNDLPSVLKEIEEYREYVAAGGSGSDLILQHGLIVETSLLAANGEYNLSRDRYRLVADSIGDYPVTRLGDHFNIVSGGTPSKSRPDFWDGKIPWVSPKDVKSRVLLDSQDHISQKGLKNSTSKLLDAETPICVVRSGILKHTLPIAILGTQMAINQDIVGFTPKSGKVNNKFLALILKFKEHDILSTGIKSGVTVQSFHTGYLSSFCFPLPPLDVQREIVEEIESYQKVIDGARTVVENYRPHIMVDQSWPVVQLSEVCESITDGDHMPPPKANDGIPFITIANLRDGVGIDLSNTFFVPKDYYEKLTPSRTPRRNDVLYAVTGSYGISTLVNIDDDFCFQRHIALLRPSSKILPGYLCVIIRSSAVAAQADRFATGIAQKTVSLGVLRRFAVPLPSLDKQSEIVQEIEVEQRLVDANKQLIDRMQRKIDATIARVWGEAPDSN